jgi:cholesterol oxidase
VDDFVLPAPGRITSNTVEPTNNNSYWIKQMSRINRRTFLGAAAASAGAAAIPSPALAGVKRKIPLTRSQERVVIIGSGFGGGVTALRLGQAGIRVLVLERGRWWRTGPNADTFPSASKPDKRLLFYSLWPQVNGERIGFNPYAGVLEPIPGKNLTTIVAAGVGGGSLLYQGMSLQPTQDLFNTWFPEQLDYSQMDSVYYPRVAQMLQLATAPDELINSAPYQAARMFASRVQAAGYHLAKIPMPIDWNYALAELRGEMKPSYTNGDGAFGVNNGGKHSVDVTYIDSAIATGNVTVATLHNVTSIARADDGTWEVHVDCTDETGKVLEQKIITTQALVLSAGTHNTVNLLMSAAARGGITDLPDGLGQGYGTNADQIYIWANLKENFGPQQGGPVIYGSFEWNDPAQPANTIIQAAAPSIGKQPNTAQQQVIAAMLPVSATAPSMVKNTRSTMVVGYGVSKGRGEFVFDARANRAVLHWPVNGDADVAKRIRERLTKVVGNGSVLINTNDFGNTTWHPLGGACIDVVCDLEGRVKGQKGLYVLDGALMPGTTCACNPSLTIAAVVERAIDRIVQDDIGTVF